MTCWPTDCSWARCRIWVAAAALVLCGPWAHAADPERDGNAAVRKSSVWEATQFDLNHTLFLDYHVNNFDGEQSNDNRGEVRNVTNLRLAMEHVSVATRFDSASFFAVPRQFRQEYRDQYRLEKATFRYRGSLVAIDLGDFYASFGRGMALQVRKVDALAVDTSLLGVKVRLRLSEVEVTALAGLSNTLDFDALNEKDVRDRYDLLSGVRGAVRIADAVTTAVHAVWVAYDPLGREDRVASQPRASLVVGTSLEAHLLSDVVGLYAEIDAIAERPQSGTAVDERRKDPLNYRGVAGYVSADASLGDLGIALEAKYYDDYDLSVWTPTRVHSQISLRQAYASPPTLEPIYAEVENNYDVWGGRLSLDVRPFGGDTLLSASYAGFLAHDPARTGHRQIHHPCVGVEQDLGDRAQVTLQAGTRMEAPDRQTADAESLFYVQTGATVSLYGPYSAALSGAHQWRQSSGPFDTQRYLKGQWSLTCSWSPYLDVGGILAYDTSPSGRRALTMFALVDGWRRRQVFVAGTVAARLWEGIVTLKLLVGDTVAEALCNEGQCREMPAFSGVRFETVARF